MKGQLNSEPGGIAGDCFYVLLMYDDGNGLAASELHERITRENEGLAGFPVPSRGQVRRGLAGLARRLPPLVRKQDGRWLITGHGYAMLDVWVPDGPGPDRVPCGLGWPS